MTQTVWRDDNGMDWVYITRELARDTQFCSTGLPYRWATQADGTIQVYANDAKIASTWYESEYRNIMTFAEFYTKTTGAQCLGWDYGDD